MTTRDLMAPDTEPTDDELAAVMDAARELAIQRRALSDAWVAARLEEAARFAREHRSLREPLTTGALDPADAASRVAPPAEDDDILYDPEDDLLPPPKPERQREDEHEDQREVS